VWYASEMATKRVEALGSFGFLSGWCVLDRLKNWRFISAGLALEVRCRVS
jgi:hypothetical protein